MRLSLEPYLYRDYRWCHHWKKAHHLFPHNRLVDLLPLPLFQYSLCQWNTEKSLVQSVEGTKVSGGLPPFSTSKLLHPVVHNILSGEPYQILRLLYLLLLKIFPYQWLHHCPIIMPRPLLNMVVHELVQLGNIILLWIKWVGRGLYFGR